MNRFLPVQAVALAAIIGLGVFGTAGCAPKDDSSNPPTTAVTPAPRNTTVAAPGDAGNPGNPGNPGSGGITRTPGALGASGNPGVSNSAGNPGHSGGAGKTGQ